MICCLGSSPIQPGMPAVSSGATPTGKPGRLPLSVKSHILNKWPAPAAPAQLRERDHRLRTTIPTGGRLSVRGDPADQRFPRLLGTDDRLFCEGGWGSSYVMKGTLNAALDAGTSTDATLDLKFTGDNCT